MTRAEREAATQAERIRELVAIAPPLSEWQRERLRELFDLSTPLPPATRKPPPHQG
jgi:hypothetical protein